jgi:hypothetical protein
VAERLEKARERRIVGLTSPERSRSSLDQTGSKTPKAIKTKEKATTGCCRELTR